MNIYSVTFSAICPADCELIEYRWRLALPKMVRVEELNSFVGEIKSGFHERIADTLFSRFGGLQRIDAVHQGVGIRTLRSAAKGGCASWAESQLNAA